MKQGRPEGALIVTHTPSRVGMGKRVDIPMRGLVVGGSETDLPVDGAQATGSRLELRWVGSGTGTGKQWQADAVGRVTVNREMTTHRMLDSGDDIRVVDTFFRFLCGTELQDQYYETIYHMTIRDMPTGLANPRYLQEAMHQEVSLASGGGIPLAVVTLQFQAPLEGSALTSHDIVGGVAETISIGIPRQWFAARSADLEITVVAPGTSREDIEGRVRGWLQACDAAIRTTTLGTAELGGAIQDAATLLAAARANATTYLPA